MSSDEAYRIAAEHIIWAVENNITPRAVLESVGITQNDIPWEPDWTMVMHWLTIVYSRHIRPELDRRNYQAKRKTEQERQHFPPAQDFRNEMRTLFSGRAA